MAHIIISLQLLRSRGQTARCAAICECSQLCRCAPTLPRSLSTSSALCSSRPFRTTVRWLKFYLCPRRGPLHSLSAQPTNQQPTTTTSKCVRLCGFFWDLRGARGWGPDCEVFSRIFGGPGDVAQIVRFFLDFRRKSDKFH